MARSPAKPAMPPRRGALGISPGPKSSYANFIGSLVLLVAALALFFFVMYPKKHIEPASEPPKTESAIERRRHSLASSTPTAGVPDEGVSSSSRDATRASGVVEPQRPEINDPDVQKAIDLIDKGSVAEAVTMLEAIVKKDPKNENALVELAMVNLLDLKQPEQAINYLQKVAEINPKNQVVMAELVSLYEEENRLEDGLQFLTEVHNKDPNGTPDIAYGIGEIMTMSGRDADAIPYLERATQSPENGVRAYRELADAYARGGDSEHALDAYGKAIAAQEKEIQDKQSRGLPTAFLAERLNYTKLDRAREFLRAGEAEKAQEIVNEVAGQMPNDEAVTALQDSINRKKAG